MNTITVIIIIALLLESIAIMVFLKKKKFYELILNTETSSITTLKKGFYEIKGMVVALKDKLKSPYLEKDCVYFKFEVEQEQSSGKSSSWRKIIKDEKYVPFYVQDRSGKAIIELSGGKFKFQKDIKTQSGSFFKNADESMERALEKYGRTSKTWNFEKRLRYRETILEEGDELYVLGEVVDFDGYYPIFRKAGSPFIISDKSEESLLKNAKRAIRWTLFFMITIPLGVAFYLLSSGVVG